MPVIITGMHRSGTSMVTRLLNLCGLDLGPEEQLMPPAPDNNPEGFWEHLALVAINDEILHHHGGSWKHPPVFPAGWETSANMRALCEHAAALPATCGFKAPWGWKDPRAALTLPFWKTVWPDQRVVICIRNPVEVALSLLKRDGLSCRAGLKLWLAYHDQLLKNVPPENRVVTHYDSYFDDPRAELQRLVEQLQLPADEGRIHSACAAIKGTLRHSRLTAAELALVEAPPDVWESYRQLCCEAGLAVEPDNTPCQSSKAAQIGRHYDDCVEKQQQHIQDLHAWLHRQQDPTAALADRERQRATQQHLLDQSARLQAQLARAETLTAALLERERQAAAELCERQQAALRIQELESRLHAQIAHSESLATTLAQQTATHQLRMQEQELHYQSKLAQLLEQMAEQTRWTHSLQDRLAARRHRYADRLVNLLRKFRPGSLSTRHSTVDLLPTPPR